MDSFEISWADMLKLNPHDLGKAPRLWAKWMLEDGYTRRLHGGVLHSRIVGVIAGI